jgi:hypothetical protein
VRPQPQSDHAMEAGKKPVSAQHLTIRLRRLELAILMALIVLAAGVLGHMYGQHVAFEDMQGLQRHIDQLEIEAQARESVMRSTNDRMALLQANIVKLQAELDAMMPSANTYSINPDQSVIVAEGRLIVGLVGAPTNDSINISINGKQQTATVGDVIKVAPDPRTTCQVKVLSFDMFAAQINASCSPLKPQ